MMIKKIIAAFLCASMLVFASTSANAADCRNAAAANAPYAVSQSSQQTVSVDIAKGKTATVTVNIRSSESVGGLLVEMKSKDIVPDLEKSGALLIEGDSGFPHFVASRERFSIVMPSDGLDCTNGVDVANIVLKGRHSTFEGTSTVTFNIIEFYEAANLNELPASGVTYSVAAAEPAHEHTPVIDPAVPATCTSEGKTEGSHCSVCGEVIVAQKTVAKTAHTPVTDPAIPATCTSEGKTEGSHCSVCGKVIVAQKTVAKTAHTPVTDPAIPATCTSEGKTEGSHCSVCGKVIKAQTPLTKKAHSYVDGVCTVCGEKDPSYTPSKPSDPTQAEKGIYGDIDGDGTLTSQDALKILRHTVGLTILWSDQQKAADVDGSTDINATDALEVLRYSLSLPTTSKAGKPI